MEGAYPSIDVDAVRQHHVHIMQLINLPSLVPVLQKHQILPKSDLDRVADAKHHGSVERSGFLLHSIYKRDQTAIDTFVKCLREDQGHSGHQEILNLLEKGLPDQPDRSVLFEILDARLGVIVSKINLTLFLNHLANSGAIKVTAFLDLVNPDRSVRDNMQRLLHVLEEKGVQGFIDFLVCLRKEHTPAHEELFRLLFNDIQVFFKEHPKRGEISASDKIEILQLETRGKVLEQEVLQRFQQHRQRLAEELSVSELLPLLQKHHVLSEDEMERVSEEGLEQREQNRRLLEAIVSKPSFWVVKFAECLKENPKNRQLSELLLPQSATGAKGKQTTIKHKKDKVVVMVELGQYQEVDLDKDLQSTRPTPQSAKSQESPIKGIKKENDALRDCFRQLDFEVIDFDLTTINSSLEVREESRVHKLLLQSHEKRLEEKFKSEVAEKCAEEAVVFVHISGIQFPIEDSEAAGGSPGKKKFSGAILLSQASPASRKEIDCLKARDILSWLRLLPRAYVTLLIDTEQKFVAKFGKHRDPHSVDITEDPWSILTGVDFSTVVYYLQPDTRAMAQPHVEQTLGVLTEGFTFALLHCQVRRGRGERERMRLCHKRFYEAVSFYWHRRVRQHRAFFPAVRGDMAREFLGKKSFAYNQVFRVDLVKKEKDDQLFDMDKLYVQTGTLAGINPDDKLELFHILHPGLRVRGSVSKSWPLNSVVTVEDAESRIRLSRAIRDIYEDQVLRTVDGSTEFLFGCKVLPPHERVSVSTEGLKDGETATIRSSVEVSPQLSFVARGNKSSLVVHRNGDVYYIADREEDVTVQVRVKRLSLIPTFLEMIAWYKHVKRLKSNRKPPLNLYSCFLTAEKPLLHTAIPLCEEFNIKWSSFENITPSSKGHEVIIHSTEPQTFWTPLAKDTQPCLEVAFKDNHVVTSIELKGNYEEGKFVRKADIYHQRDTYKDVVRYSHEDLVSRSIKFSKEPVQFVTLHPLELPEGNDFKIGFRMTRTMISGSETVSVPVQDITVTNWWYHHQQAGWKFIPSPNTNGYINLHERDLEYGWISWSGRSHDPPLTLDLMTGINLEKIEFTSTSANYLKKFLLRVQSTWKKEELLPISSPWPRKHEFPRPLVVSNIQLWPDTGAASSAQPQQQQQQQQQGQLGPSNVRVQMQLYGNKHEKPLEVEEGEILSFHFSNLTQNSHFVYILCFEETGDIKKVMMDVAEPMYLVKDEHGKDVPKFHVMKKLIQTYIPEGYSRELNQIKDTYKVFISEHKLYLEPFRQRSLKFYHHPCSYAVCGVGHKELRKTEDWYGVTFEVIVKRSTSQLS